MPAVARWGTVTSNLKLKIYGFPGGAGHIADKGRGHYWETGDKVESAEPGSFMQTRTPDAGMLKLDGPDETRPGMSGGGIFDSEGVFVGIHRSVTDIALARNAISAEHIRHWLMARRLLPVQEFLHEMDHFEVCCLTGTHVMVDRTKLRDALRQISRPLGKRILVVKGEPKTGKSHTLQLISYLRHVFGNFILVVIDLESFIRTVGKNAIIEPWDMARRIVKLVGYDMEVPERPHDAQWARWVLDFCDDFEGRALREQAQQDVPIRWIVIDGLNAVLLTQPTLDLIKELAFRISVTLTKFRLILLGYAESLPAQVLPVAEEEHIDAIGQNELIEFFARARKQLKIPFDDDKLVQAVQHMLDKLVPDEPDFMAHLGSLANEELELIKVTVPERAP
jgi:hypothetical protein